MERRTAEILLKIFGYASLFFGGFLFLIGFAMWVEGDPRFYEAGRALAIISLIFIVPGALMVRKARKYAARRSTMNHIVQLVRSYRRISMELLGQKAGLPPHEAEEMLLAAVKEGLLRGITDRTTGDFSIDEAEPIGPKNCPSCGASLEGLYYRGDTVKCAHCGNLCR
ncbi:MAG: PCI domain-containing protein [Spirochaetes bacterium]|nr:PCI domain-containing protein [Spirochaetota bacterium]